MSYLIISCTNRKTPNSRVIAQYYAGLLTQTGQQVKILDLQHLPHDFVFSALYENAQQNDEFNAVASQLNEADKYIFIIPEYNGSYPEVFKAFIDGLEYPSPLQNKKAALLAHSAGDQGGALALSHATDVLHYLGVNVLAMKVRLPKIYEHLQGDGLDDAYTDLVKEQIGLFTSY